MASAEAGDRSVEIEVTGSIAPYCANSETNIPVDLGKLDRPGKVVAGFTVDCNAPFQYTMQSEHGAMRLENAPADADREKTTHPYTVRLRIPLTRGGEINDTCTSADIKQGAITCKFSDSGEKIAINQKATANITWSAPQDGLQPGNYSDNLTVSVNARP